MRIDIEYFILALLLAALLGLGVGFVAGVVANESSRTDCERVVI